jgi:DNA-binding NarL/FixJ family response regulator
MIKKNIIMLDDHSLFLRGMTLLLKDCFTECDVFAYQSIKLLKKDRLNYNDFDLLISDIELPGEDTFGFLENLLKKYPQLPVLVVSMHKKNAVIRRCKEIGIKGYLLKDEDDKLTEAIEVIINGGDFYSKSIQEFCEKTRESFINISEREEDIIKQMSKGYKNNEIAKNLCLSVETVKTHKKNIKLKLGVHTTQEIIEYAHKFYMM